MKPQALLPATAVCVHVYATNVQIFIDRDPDSFEPILHYLRTKEVKLR